MDKILDIFKQHNGYIRMKDLKAAGVQPRDIARLIQEELIEKVKPGLYRLSELIETGAIAVSFIDTCQAIPQGVICLFSALEYYELTTFNPSEVYVALPHASKAPSLNYPIIRTFYFRKRFYQLGINTIETRYGKIQIYNPEKSICDAFRYRKKLGEDIPMEALKNYLKKKNANINLLMDYAVQCQVKTIVTPLIKILIHE